MKISEMNDTDKLFYTLETMKGQRDILLAAAKAAKPYLEDSQLNDFIDIEKVRAMLRQAVVLAEKE